ncbi:MAG: HPF/RaiA family ribosome-associated protein [Bdellovibrionaceae bacterium]|nr:HPF/RaiA family ribosome-associated protein [Pseudobdellovibrionaceae bacterium]
MIQIKFKNLEKSELAREAAQETIESLVEKFGDLNESKIQITLEMKCSPRQAEPDLFKVRLHVVRGRYDGITVETDNPNLYIALAEVVDHMLEVLNRFGDRAGENERKQDREIWKNLAASLNPDEQHVR